MFTSSNLEEKEGTTIQAQSSDVQRAKAGLLFWAKVAWVAFLITFMKPTQR
jgi:hypothetical protein